MLLRWVTWIILRIKVESVIGKCLNLAISKHKFSSKLKITLKSQTFKWICVDLV